jgi:hypothetical protein
MLNLIVLDAEKRFCPIETNPVFFFLPRVSEFLILLISDPCVFNFIFIFSILTIVCIFLFSHVFRRIADR